MDDSEETGVQDSAGNGPATQGDATVVEEKPSVTPSAQTPSSPSPSPSSVSSTSSASESARHFPQTLVAMDPPTLPGAGLLPPPPEFRQFPAPQRSVPGHPKLRDRLRRILLFWRRGS